MDYTQFGLSTSEIDLYFSLLKLGEATIAECLKLCNVHRTSAYNGMRRLVEFGLVAEFPGKPLKFAALPPKIALDEFLKKRKRQLKTETSEKIEDLREELHFNEQYLEHGLERLSNNLFDEAISYYSKPNENIENGPDIMVLKGIKSTLAAMKGVDLKKRLRVVSRLPLFTPFDEEYELRQMKTLQASDCRMDTILQRGYQEHPHMRRLVEIYLTHGQEVRITDSVPGKLIIYDDSDAFFLLEKSEDPENAVFIRINNQPIIHFLIFSWEYLWSRSTSLTLKDLRQIR